MYCEEDWMNVLRMKPEKKTLMYCMMIMFGTLQISLILVI